MAMEGKNKTLVQTVAVVLTMGALAWASVPFYDWFCRVTGFGGTTSVAETGSDTILDETVTGNRSHQAGKTDAYVHYGPESHTPLSLGL